MAVMHLGAGLPGRADDLLRAVDARLRDHLDQVPRVRERGHAGFGGQPGDLEVLARIGGWRIADQHADAQRSVGQVGRQPGQHGGDLRRA